MTFQEKSTWVSLLATLLIFGFYFANAVRILSEPQTPIEQLIPFFIAAVVLIVLVETGLHIVLAIVFRREAEAGEDERGNLIELRATRISYFVLAAGAWIAGTSILMTTSPIVIANLIMFFFILAEIVGFSAQLFYYRRGI